MLYREIIAVCSQIHTKHINTLCGQNVDLLNIKPVVHIVTTGLAQTYEVTLSCVFTVTWFYYMRRVWKFNHSSTIATSGSSDAT